MDRLKSGSKTKLAANYTRECFSVFRVLQRTFIGKRDRYNENGSIRSGYRYHYYLLQLVSLFSCLPTYANTSAVANPQSNTSSSVSNFATQVLTGPMTENTYGNGIKCSGATLSVSPFATTSVAIKRPQDYIYHTPVYNEATDDDGNLTNAGEILFFRENYSGNKDATSFNFGIAATISVPLDKRFQDACLKSATTQEKIQRQILSKERLNYELARLKNCGQLYRDGIRFTKDSKYYSLCEDIEVVPKMGQVIPHTHKLKSN